MFWLAVASATCAVAFVACTGSSGGGTAGASRGGGRGPAGGKIRTADGYEVILANPSKGLGPAPSKAGDLAKQRAREHLVRTPTSPDPKGGRFTLEDAVVGMPIDGSLVAEIGTDLGTVLCDLYADKTPNTVANFIGLARGTRPWWDARAGAWSTQPYYRETGFHRVIPGYMVQGGDYLGDGTGTVGYEIRDEMRPDLRHDRAGQLCMANTGPNKNGAQFFITDGPAPQLDRDNTFTIFGQCQQTNIISQIARVPQGGDDNRPLTPVGIARLFIRRVVGGAANATRTLPQRAPEDQGNGTNASPGPSDLYHDVPPPLRPSGTPTPSAPHVPRPSTSGPSGATAPPSGR